MSGVQELQPQDPVTRWPGVGAERALLLERLGVRTLEDLVLLRPRRHEDRRHGLKLVEIREKGPTAARGRVVAAGVKRFRGGGKSVFEVVLDDGTARLHCRWWNMSYLEGRFAVGEELMVYGRVVELKPRSMDHPETETVTADEERSIHMDRIVPVYPLTEGLPQRWLRARLWGVVSALADRLPETHPQVSRRGMPTRAEALRWIHFPEDMTDIEVARQRLAFDEMVALQWSIQKRRRELFARVTGLPCVGDNRWIRPFLARLGFKLTDAQTSVLREVRRDLSSGHPMRRLVQGDVGCGKTVVAACAALMTLESGYSVAIMAPTEILARQHYARFREWFAPLGLAVQLRTGAGVEDSPGAPGAPGVTLGTHALIASGFLPENLGLVVIDEQHKFGVGQRETLVRKGRYPHLLVMTATPIPRTLALTWYGDLDCSVIGASPAGRGSIRTRVRSRRDLAKVWDLVKAELVRGRQAYVVCARVDEDASADVKAVLREWEELGRVFAPYPVGLLHGRMPSAEKDDVMARFRAGRVSVLVSTLVIEVGVDVPNATVMVVEDAEQFGLAQLHQLRGRIGRGGENGTCVLVAGRDTAESRARLRVLEECADGFAIAEQDLRMRGPGELLGQAQSGSPDLRFGDLVSDGALVERARAAVAEAMGDARGVQIR